MAHVELGQDFSGFERGGGNAAQRLAAQVSLMRKAGEFNGPADVQSPDLTRDSELGGLSHALEVQNALPTLYQQYNRNGGK